MIALARRILKLAERVWKTDKPPTGSARVTNSISRIVNARNARIEELRNNQPARKLLKVGYGDFIHERVERIKRKDVQVGKREVTITQAVKSHDQRLFFPIVGCTSMTRESKDISAG